MEIVNKTIECICEKIQALAKENKCETNRELAELTKALAVLIEAKANVRIANN